MIGPSKWNRVVTKSLVILYIRKVAVTVLLLCFLGTTIWGQVGKRHDSLISDLTEQTSAQDSVEILYKLLRLNLQARPDTAFIYLETLKKYDFLEQNQKIELVRLEAQYWKKKKDFAQSSGLYKECINESKEDKQRANCHFGLADNYMKQGALDLAIEHFIHAANLFSALSLTGRLSSTYNKLGKCFDEAGYYVRAIEVFEKALIIQYDLGNSKAAMQYEKNLGDVLLKSGKNEEAMNHYRASYQLAKEGELNYMIQSLHLDFAEEYIKEGKLDSAYFYANQAYDYYDIQKKNYPSMINSRLVLGDIRLYEKRLDQAIDYYKSGLQLAEERKRTYQIIEVNKRLSKAYEAKKDAPRAMQYLSTATTMNDSVIHMESQQQILMLNEAYESEIKDKEIVNLSSQNSIQKLELDRSKLQTLLAVFGVLAAGLIAFLLFRSLKAKRQSEQVLKEKNDIISSALSDKELLLKEIHHRVKNNLQIISSLLGLQSEYIKDDTALTAINEGRNRVRSMALIHQNLYKEDNLSGINIKSYLEKLITGLFDTYNLGPDSITLELAIEDITLDVDTVVPLGLIANEVVSNALKHAFPEGRAGKISVTFYKENDQLVFKVVDDGIGMDPMIINDDINTFGFQMIQAFKDKMEAELIVESEGGTTITLVMNDIVEKQNI